MKGHFKKRVCKCSSNKCTCGGTWSFTVDVGKDPLTGKRKRAFGSGFKTKQEAEAAVAAIITDVNQGTFIKESEILFKDWVNDWLSFYIERNRPKSGTIRIRKYSIKVIDILCAFKIKKYLGRNVSIYFK
ncbi:MAG TPA: Arm DNA-binding domain-containing protein [Bacillales bacterium]|nr:Arm DNA-binding domain-containing protein [Bacillales bacterium]